MKVRLNVGRIRDHPDFPNLVWEYRDFIEKSEGKVFKVVIDKKFTTDDSLVLLQEGDHEYKWLIHISNLIRIKGD